MCSPSPSLLDCRCLYWFGDSWLSDADNLRCEPPRSELLTQNYIECRCSLLGNFSARAQLSTSYGWYFPAPASCGLVIVSWTHLTLHHALCSTVFRAVCGGVGVGVWVGVGVRVGVGVGVWVGVGVGMYHNMCCVLVY